MIERRLRTMPPHSSMPHSIPRIRGGNGHWPVRPQIGIKPVDDPYGAGFHDNASRYIVSKPLIVNHRPKYFDGYIGPVDVIPGEPLFVIAQLRGVIINGEFVPQPVKTPTDALVFAARARIGLNQEGFFAVSAARGLLSMQVVSAAGLLQKVSVKMPPYDPSQLVVEYRNSLIIASAK